MPKPPARRLLQLPSSVGAALDVGLASLGSLTVGLAAAGGLSLGAFGALSSCLLISIIVAGYARQMFGDTLVLRYASREQDSRQAAGRRALGATVMTAMVIAPAVGLLTWGVLWASWGDHTASWQMALAMACATPLVATQEVARNVAYCRGKVWSATGNSAARLCSLLLLVLVADAGTGSPVAYLVAWGLSAVVGSAVGLLMLRDRPALGLSWLSENRSLGRTLAADFTLTLSSAEISMLLISSLAGADAIGSIRKAQLPMAPLTLLTTGASVFLQPVLVRRVAGGAKPRALLRFSYVAAGVIVSAGVVWFAVLWWIPTEQMERVLGDGWDRAHSILPLITAYLSLGVIAGLLGISLRAIGVVKRQVRTRLVLAPLTLAAVGAAALHSGAAAMAVLCLNALAVCVIWHVLVVRADRGEGIDNHDS